jgi:hypothetical protein
MLQENNTMPPRWRHGTNTLAAAGRWRTTSLGVGGFWKRISLIETAAARPGNPSQELKLQPAAG